MCINGYFIERFDFDTTTHDQALIIEIDFVTVFTL